MSKQYLTIMRESLEKKLDILGEIQRISQYQSEILDKHPVVYEDFDQCVNDKDLCIDQLSELDDGFETLYERVKEELTGNREKYADEIKKMQELISQITELSVAVQAQEERNRKGVEAAIKRDRQENGKGRRSAKVAMDYYRSMSAGTNPSQFMDEKN